MTCTLSCLNLIKSRRIHNGSICHLLIIQLKTIIMIIERDKLSCSVLFVHRRFDSPYASQTIWQSFWDFSTSFSLPKLKKNTFLRLSKKILQGCLLKMIQCIGACISTSNCKRNHRSFIIICAKKSWDSFFSDKIPLLRE